VAKLCLSVAKDCRSGGKKMWQIAKVLKTQAGITFAW
jgi:hypothetical protein